jgi:hypothetical protein
MTTTTSMRLALTGIVLFCLFLTGCFVGSLQPLFNPTDPVFDKNLLGTWVSADERSTMIVSRIPGAQQDKQYHLVYITEGAGSVYQATLVDIAKTRYLDVYSRDPSRRPDIHYIPTHSFWKVTLEGDSLKTAGMSEAWLKEQIDKRIPQFPAARVDDDVVLTGTTNELQEFVRGYSDQLFSEEGTVWKKR